MLPSLPAALVAFGHTHRSGPHSSRGWIHRCPAWPESGSIRERDRRSLHPGGISEDTCGLWPPGGGGRLEGLGGGKPVQGGAGWDLEGRKEPPTPPPAPPLPPRAPGPQAILGTGQREGGLLGPPQFCKKDHVETVPLPPACLSFPRTARWMCFNRFRADKILFIFGC